MSLLKRVFALCAALLPLVSFAQNSNPLPKTLLWRISGHGLSKPSYLFGTIHLTDKGLFNFGDSLYTAIAHTDGLAIEVNPDEMIAYVINTAMDDAGSKLLKDDLTEEEFRHYAPSLSKKLHKRAEDITSQDIVHEKNRWMSDFLAKGEMPTFVDAYLYNMAKRQGKWVGGIEDLADQTGLLNTLYDKSDLDQITADSTPQFSLTKLLKLYIAQDLNGIAASLKGFDSTKRDALLTRRNIKMARRMDSLSAFRSMFFAVGAAHLPGADGVIALLRQRGFTVEPVFSSSTLPADQYKYPKLPVVWQRVTDVDSLYSVSMPGQVIDTKLYGILNMKFMFDISNMTGYCSMAFAGTNKSRNIDTIGRAMADHMFGKYAKVATKHVTRNGLTGVEFTGSKDNFKGRIQVFNRDNILYVVFVVAHKTEMLGTDDAEKFFSSFTVHNPSPKKQHNETLTDARFGVSLTAPAHMSVSSKGSSIGGWDHVTYLGVDAAHELAIVLKVKATGAGYYIPDDSSLLADIGSMLKAGDTIIRKTITVDGRRAYEIEGHDKDGNVLRFLSLTRGNKHIAVCVVASEASAHLGVVDSILGSLKLLPYTEMQWASTTTANGAFRTWAPQSFATGGDTGMREYSFDSLSTTSYYIETDTLDEFAWYPTDTAYYYGRIRAYAGDNPVVSIKQLHHDKYTGAEGWIAQTATASYSRIRVIGLGRVVCFLTATGEKEVLESANADKFFTSLAPAVTPAPFSLTSSKARQLITALNSKDSATQEKAITALRTVEPVPADLALWCEAMYKHYKLDWGDSLYINEQLGELVSRSNDPSIIQYIMTHPDAAAAYPEVTTNVLASIHQAPSYNALVQFLGQHSSAMNYNALAQMKDSLPLLAGAFPRLLPLGADTTIAPYVADMALTLRDSGLLSTPDLMAYQPQFVSVVHQIAPARARSDYNAYPYYSLVKLMGTYNTKSSLDALDLLARTKDKYLLMQVAIELLKHDRKVDSTLLKSLAADPTIRYSLYTSLQQAGRERFYPHAYSGQKYFAESAMNSAATDDDEEPTAIKPLGERITSLDGTRYRFYLYRVAYGDDPKRSFLGIAGPYDISGKDIEPKQAYTGLYWSTPYSPTKTDLYFNDFLKERKEALAAAED